MLDGVRVVSYHYAVRDTMDTMDTIIYKVNMENQDLENGCKKMVSMVSPP